MSIRVFSFKMLLVCLISILSAGMLRAQIRAHLPKEGELAGLHPEVVWQRTSPSVKNPEGPVLYQIIFRSNAAPGTIPVISNTFTLTNSPITVGSGMVAIGGLGINSTTGIISFAATQTFPGAGTVTGITAGSGLNGGTINTSGTITLNTSFTDARYLQLSGGVVTGPVGFGATTNGQSLIDINGTQTEVSNNEVLLRVDGTLNSSPGNSYSTALGVYPTTTMTGY
ncbi:MAG TPA: hypothetical protein VFA71_02195, partial [Terriglobales bacterium]|nr:hypothetical protein [Terriglobales bacterium]